MPRPRSDIEPRILESARERFLKDGVDGASLRAIASDAGTSIGMVYYYFPTKDELFFAVVEEAYEKLMLDLEGALSPEKPVEQRLLALFERFGSISDREQQVVRLVLREALVSSERLERVIERFKRGHIPLVLKTVLDGIHDGTFDRSLSPVAIAIATVVLAGPAQFIRRAAGARLPLPAGPAEQDFSKVLVGILLQGVGSKA